MRVVIQRVKEAVLSVEHSVYSRISDGLLILLGIEEEDGQDDILWLCKKIIGMRIFSDKEEKMNLSVKDISGALMVVSQFTLHASTKKGNRPSFIRAAQSDKAIQLYKLFVERLSLDSGLRVETGKFGAMMDIALVNSGPVTILMDSKNRE